MHGAKFNCFAASAFLVLAFAAQAAGVVPPAGGSPCAAILAAPAARFDAAAQYNLATCLAESGETARAVRHYRQALRLAPVFPGARENLLMLRRDAGLPLDEPPPVHPLDLVAAIPRWAWAAAAVAANAALALALRRRRILPALACAMLIAVSGFLYARGWLAADGVVVVAREESLRPQTGTAATPHAVLVLPGLAVRTLATRGASTHVLLPSGEEGWLPSSALLPPL